MTHTRRWLAGVVLLLASTTVVACSSDDDPAAVDTPDASAQDGSNDSEDQSDGDGDGGGATAPEPEIFTGSTDDFYVVPDPLPPGEPGDLIRIQDLGTEDGRTTLRVMYHSVDRNGQDRAVTGIITHPTAEAPEEGWPVYAWAHGTTGLASVCAPSRAGAPAISFGEGVTVVSDYIGLGPVGERHPYLSATAEAHGVIDSIRAARNLPATGAGTRWVTGGHSQGGHAALFTHELAETYAPELEYLGGIATGPAAMFEHRYGPADDIVPRMVQVMGLYGMAADHPEIDPHDYVNEDVAAVDEIIDTGCTMDVVAAMAPIPAETFYDEDPIRTEPARSIVLANDPGQVAVDAPLLLVYGTLDDWVVPDRVLALNDRLCGVGQQVELVEVEGADHGNLVQVAHEQISDWFADRFAGLEAGDTCP